MEKNINDFYKEILKGKDVSIPNIKSWELIKEKNKNNSDLIALSEADKKITYGEMFDNFEKNAKAFSSLGINRHNNSRVLVLMPNVAETCYIDYALDMTGAVCDFIDPTSSYDKVKKYVENEKITDIISLDLMFLKTLYNKRKELKEKYGIKNMIIYHSDFMTKVLPRSIRIYSELINKVIDKKVLKMENIINDSRYENITYDHLDSKNLSLITHTSGTTTGIGKPITLTDYNRNALAKQYELACFNYKPGMKMMHFIPYFASYGSVNTTNLGLVEGMELMEIPLFSPDKFAEILLKLKPNIVLANTPCWLNLIKSSYAQNADLSFLTYASSGGMNTSVEDEEKINDFLKKHNASVALTKGYGLSELGGCSVTTIDGFNKVGSPGVPLPLVDIKIRNLEINCFEKLYEKDVQGEAFIHTETMTSGILDDKRIIDIKEIDGKNYLPTKDVLKIYKNGFVEYIERIDRMFPRYDGYNVYPRPIEEYIKKDSRVNNCVIVPLFDSEKNGMVPRVYIEEKEIIEDKNKFIKNIIDNFFIKSIGEYKANFRDIPHSWVFANIPKNTMGKDDYYSLKNGLIQGEEYKIIIIENNMNVKSISVQRVNNRISKCLTKSII
ncbi:aMP-binding enzyme [Firmicutes bacterium CAG:884]|nr:aMP-binding enzyme [Firmicutes bacterium CAG:884]